MGFEEDRVTKLTPTSLEQEIDRAVIGIVVPGDPVLELFVGQGRDEDRDVADRRVPDDAAVRKRDGGSSTHAVLPARAFRSTSEQTLARPRGRVVRYERRAYIVVGAVEIYEQTAVASAYPRGAETLRGVVQSVNLVVGISPEVNLRPGSKELARPLEPDVRKADDERCETDGGIEEKRSIGPWGEIEVVIAQDLATTVAGIG